MNVKVALYIQICLPASGSARDLVDDFTRSQARRSWRHLLARLLYTADKRMRGDCWAVDTVSAISSGRAMTRLAGSLFEGCLSLGILDAFHLVPARPALAAKVLLLLLLLLRVFWLEVDSRRGLDRGKALRG